VADLALLLELAERAERLRDRHRGIDSVQLEEVDALEAEPAQRQLALLAKVLRATDRLPIAGARSREARLGGDHEIVGVGMERLVDQLLGDRRSVGVGGVDEVHALLDRAPEHADRLVGVGGRTPHPFAGELHRPVPEAVDPQVAAQLERAGL
jgi:hypothetical protein